VAKRIAVDQARPGQILAEEITRQDGVLLASRSSEVTEGLLRLLGRMNVDTVVIEEAEQRTGEDIRAEHRCELERIARAFRRAGGSPVLTALRRTLVFLSEQERDKALEHLELAREPEPPVPGTGEDVGAAHRAEHIEIRDAAAPARRAARPETEEASGSAAPPARRKAGRGAAGPASGKES
jgi:hypothetical protein